jgi:hypothetical protein
MSADKREVSGRKQEWPGALRNTSRADYTLDSSYLDGWHNHR